MGLEKLRFPAKAYGEHGQIKSPGGFFTLYYSPACQAKWVQVYRDDYYFSTAWVETKDGEGFRESVWDKGASGWTSSMFYTPPGVRVRGCVQAFSCSGQCESGYSTTYCSDYH